MSLRFIMECCPDFITDEADKDFLSVEMRQEKNLKDKKELKKNKRRRHIEDKIELFITGNTNIC